MSLIMHPPSGTEENFVQVKIHSNKVMILASCFSTEVLSFHCGKNNGVYQEGLKEKEFFSRDNKPKIRTLTLCDSSNNDKHGWWA